MRWGTAIALATIGPEAIEAVPALIDRLKDVDDGVRQAAARALARFDHFKKLGTGLSGKSAADVAKLFVHTPAGDEHQ